MKYFLGLLAIRSMNRIGKPPSLTGLADSCVTYLVYFPASAAFTFSGVAGRL